MQSFKIRYKCHCVTITACYGVFFIQLIHKAILRHGRYFPYHHSYLLICVHRNFDTLFVAIKVRVLTHGTIRYSASHATLPHCNAKFVTPL